MRHVLAGVLCLGLATLLPGCADGYAAFGISDPYVASYAGGYLGGYSGYSNPYNSYSNPYQPYSYGTPYAGQYYSPAPLCFLCGHERRGGWERHREWRHERHERREWHHDSWGHRDHDRRGGW